MPIQGKIIPEIIMALIRYLPDLLKDKKEARKVRTLEEERMHAKVVLYDYAMHLAGLPYIWGGDDSVSGYDCSGYVIELLQSVGVLPPLFDMTADGLWHHFDSERASEPRFGALVFFGNPQKVTHVGFCVNNKFMLEAGGGGSRTTDREKAAEQNAYIRLRPIHTRRDLVGFVHPRYPWKG